MRRFIAFADIALRCRYIHVMLIGTIFVCRLPLMPRAMRARAAALLHEQEYAATYMPRAPRGALRFHARHYRHARRG